MNKGVKIPNVKWKVRTKNEEENYGWADMTTEDVFAGKKVAVFSLPGAFTPTCSNTHLPGYEEAYDKLKSFVDEVYCISVNDAFVMNAWAKDLGVEKVKMIPDGSGAFTRNMGMLVEKPAQGFGQRSWRYSMVCEDGVCTIFNEEPGRNDNSNDNDPFTVSDAKTMLKQLGEKSFIQDITSNN